jgi:hypothetical protein
MDLLSIIGKIWQHRLVTIPVILLTFLGAFYVLKVKAPVYQSTSSIMLVNPPAPPTPAQITTNPSLGKVNSNNTFAQFSSLDVAADAVIGIVTAESNQLVQAGVDPRYQLTLSTADGDPPIITVTGIASSAQNAIQSADLVTKAAMTSLNQMQVQQNINPKYMIKSIELYAPQNAQQSISGKLRALIAVIAAGAILLFVGISLVESFAIRRRGKSFPETRHSSKSFPETRHSSESFPAQPARRSDEVDDLIINDDDTMSIPRVFESADGDARE